MNDILMSAPIWSSFLFSLIPLTMKVLNKNKEPHLFWPFFINTLAVLTATGFLFFNKPGEDIVLFSSALFFNKMIFWASLLLYITFIGASLMSFFHPQTDKKRFSEHLFLLQGALLGLLVLLWSNNLLSAFIGLETASLCFYLLIALGRTGPKALIAGFKYFVIGSLSAAFLLYGICFVLGASGALDLKLILSENPDLFTSSRLLILGLALIFAGLLFKISIFPFHFYLPDVYGAAMTPLLVFMAVGVKIAVFSFLFQWTKDFFLQVNMPGLFSFLQWLAVLSVLFGNIIALQKNDLKKMLLFSTVAHSGYLLMISLSGALGFSLSSSFLIYYLMVYALMTLGIFICLTCFEKEDLPSIENSHIKGLAYRKPLQAGLISLFLISLAGLPPTGGFLIKLFLFQSLINQGLWWLLFWTIIGSAVALYYYLKPISLMYMEKDSEPKEAKSLPQALLLSAICLALFVLLSGIFPALPALI